MNIRFGLDGIIGLAPGLGDVLAGDGLNVALTNLARFWDCS
jgi:hypothetical protein